MRVAERSQVQWAAICDWCDGLQVSAWYSDRRTIVRCLVSHRRLHTKQGKRGVSIRVNG